MRCPRCQVPMNVAVERSPRGRIELDYCPQCRGVWFDAHELAALLQLGNLNAFAVGSPLLLGDRPTLPCPRHEQVSMKERQLSTETEQESRSRLRLRIDQCPLCEGIWLDGGELHMMSAAMRTDRVQPFLQDPDTARMDSPGLWLFMFLTGLPIEQWNPRVRRPVAVVALIVACALIFLWQASGRDPAATTMRYGLLLANLLPSSGFTLLSYMFLHGGAWHLLGNLYFLWVFGDNVEDRLGWPRFLLLYFLSGMAAGLCHCLLTSDPQVPVIGASGAISGVMAAYAVLFPQARLISLILFWRVRWRATTYLGMWLMLQVLFAALHRPGIAWWAHIGGFVVGGALAWAMRPSASLPGPQPVFS